MKIIYFFLIFFLLVNNQILSQRIFPEWAKGIVWYQIFPERFANGDKDNDPTAEKVFKVTNRNPEGWQVREWTSNWFLKDEWEKKAGGNLRDHLYERRYGGDIQGIIDHLDYIKELGTGAIYLNPVFEAVSLHKYDGSTFHHIDINFGPEPEEDIESIKSEIPDDPSTWKWTEADKLFLELIEEVHERGMKIIIDGVFNHTGLQFWAFQDIVKNGKQSKYSDWYIINSFDNTSTSENEFDYKGWWNSKYLPEFNRTINDLHPEVKQYVFHSTKRWMDPNNDGDCSDGIDGWRLDVAREVPLGFWKDWSNLVKSINPEAIIVGELWELSPDFISEEGPFDALMNYSFAFAVNDFFIADKNKIAASEFVENLEEIKKNYPEKNLHVLQNLIGSHDTERLSSMILNPDKNFDRDANEENPGYNPGKPSKEVYENQKLIFAFQIFYKGAPMIYYGDEVGMWGADDPHCRKPMIWNEMTYQDEIIDESSGFEKGVGSFKVEQDTNLLNFYTRLIGLRNENKALKFGNAEFLYSNDDNGIIAFKREFNNEKFLAVFNTGKEDDTIEINLPSEKNQYIELITGEEGSFKGSPAVLNIEIPADSFIIYKIY